MILFFVTYKIKSNNTQIIIISKQVTPNMYNKYHSIFGNSIIFISDIKPLINKKSIFYYDTSDVVNKGFTNMHSKIE